MPVTFSALPKLVKQCWMFFAALIIIAAILSSLFRAFTPLVKQYKTVVEEKLSAFVGKPVTIASLETSWYWFEPVIKLKNVSISTGNHDPIKLEKLLVGINLFRSLWSWQIQPGVLYAEGINLSIQQTADRWQIRGLEGLGQGQSLDAMPSTKAMAWVLAQEKIIIKNVSATAFLQDATQIPVTLLDLSILQRSGHYHVTGNAYLQQKRATFFHILADVKADPYALKKSSGKVYLSASQVQLLQWQKFFPQSRITIEDGLGDVQLWLDWQLGTVKNAQSRISFRNLALKDAATKKNRLFSFANANLAWTQSAKEWLFSADHIRFQLDNVLWPENKLMVRFQKDNDTFYVYVKHIILESLMSVMPDFPEKFKQITAVKPHGKLDDTQCQIKAGQMDYLLTSFSSLGWRAVNSIPRVDNLTGVLHWQPSEGMLELGGENTIVEPENQPLVQFTELNTLIEWKELSHGLRVSLERLVINHPDLLVSASGAVDDVLTDSAGQINLLAQISATNAQRWLPYLPSGHIKQQVDSWLKKSIKKIDNLVAEVTVNGLAADFPFDKMPGEFKIDGHVRGMDFIFTPGWPLTKDFEAFLSVNKRNLDINVVNARLQDIDVKNANVQINDIGEGKEALLLHLVVDTEAKNALTYVLSSPLNTKLNALKHLKPGGECNLDLHLEVPLYPENDEVLTVGNLTFKNNTIKFNRAGMDGLQFNDLNGSLRFTQQGFMDSTLKASFLDYPVQAFIQSVLKPVSSILVTINATTSIEVLRQKFNLSVLSFMQGEFDLEGLLTITNKPDDLDHLTFKTSLQGVAVNLPAPFAKAAKQIAPLNFDVDFNLATSFRMRMNYDNRISSDVWFAWPKGKLELENGVIRLGSGGALWQSKPGLEIIGNLPVLDVSVWRALWAKFPASNVTMLFMDAAQFIDVVLKDAIISNQHYANMRIKVQRLSRKEWSINLDQKDVAARLRYLPDANKVSGTFSKLHLYKIPKTTDTGSKSALNPDDMPNLELQINGFQFENVQPGNISLKASTHNHVWQLDYCKIETPYYQFTAKGQWTKKGNENRSSIQAQMTLNDLAKALARWNISPVVHAKKGNIQFEGTWPGAFYDFSLTRVSGKLNIAFANGRITDLSRETEEKLGLGKLLSILSLQTLPRRLTLDFSDLSQKGYSFDEFKGSFKVENGLMKTTDSFINGPIAYASMQGSLDIAKQFYNLELRVTPYVTASLPVVATIAGGPVAGIATWVVSKIINKGMQKVSGYTYKITGPWKHPVVQQVSIIKQLKH